MEHFITSIFIGLCIYSLHKRYYYKGPIGLYTEEVIITLLFYSILLGITLSVWERCAFYKSDPIYIESKLLSYNYTYDPWGLYIRSVESHTTTWDCGKFGKVTSADKKIFTHSKPISTLILKEYKNKVKLWDIVVPNNQKKESFS